MHSVPAAVSVTDLALTNCVTALETVPQSYLSLLIVTFPMSYSFDRV